MTCACFCVAVKLFPVTCEYIGGEKQFYHRAQRFYQDVPASEEGMMGDFVDISNVDLEASRQFLRRFVVSLPACGVSSAASRTDLRQDARAQTRPGASDLELKRLFWEDLLRSVTEAPNSKGERWNAVG